MSHAELTTEDLITFASTLTEYATGVEEQTGRIASLLKEMGETWRDREYEKFAEELEGTLRQVGTVLNDVTEQVAFLHRKAERADDYLEQR